MTKNRRLTAIVLTVPLLLLVPFIGMQFTNEVDWDLRDFLIMGTLLLTTGLLCELVIRKVHNKQYRLIFCGAILLALVLIWMELAVGIFGTPLAGS